MRVQASTAVIQRDTSGQRLGQSMRPTSVTPQSYGCLGSKRSSIGASRHTREDEINLNLLQKQVRTLQLEKEKMKELIDELKQTNQFFSGERDLLEEKLKNKNAQLHKFASQCQANAQKVFMLE